MPKKYNQPVLGFLLQKGLKGFTKHFLIVLLFLNEGARRKSVFTFQFLNDESAKWIFLT